MVGTTFIPKFKRPDKSEIIYLNEDLEQIFTQKQLNKMSNMWDKYYTRQEIANEYGRDSDEISLALFHLDRCEKLIRPFKLGMIDKVIAEKPKVG